MMHGTTRPELVPNAPGSFFPNFWKYHPTSATTTCFKGATFQKNCKEKNSAAAAQSMPNLQYL
jgi:hypothetical protein